MIGTPFFILFGWLSDKIGRKPIIMAGCLIAALTYFPIFKGLTHYGNPAMEEAAATSPVVVVADPATCSFQFDPVGKTSFTSSLRHRQGGAGQGRRAVQQPGRAGRHGRARSTSVGDAVDAFEGAGLDRPTFKARSDEFGEALKAALTAAGYPEKADPARINKPMVLLLLSHPGDLRDHGLRPDRGVAGGAVPDPDPLHLDVAAVPHRQRLVRRLPADHRLRAWSRPRGNIYYGLWYPIVIAADDPGDRHAVPAARPRTSTSPSKRSPRRRAARSGNPGAGPQGPAFFVCAVQVSSRVPGSVLGHRWPRPCGRARCPDARRDYCGGAASSLALRKPSRLTSCLRNVAARRSLVLRPGSGPGPCRRAVRRRSARASRLRVARIEGVAHPVQVFGQADAAVAVAVHARQVFAGRADLGAGAQAADSRSGTAMCTRMHGAL